MPRGRYAAAAGVYRSREGRSWVVMAGGLVRTKL